MMQKIFLLGPQGSGKGTQALRLSQKLHVPALSMGHLLREEMASKSELGTLIQSYVDKGNLVPDDVALDVLKKRLEREDAKRGYVLDGYPRNLAQFHTFEAFDAPSAVLVLEVPREESVRRILERAVIEARADDTPEVIGRRLQIYEEDTKPVIEKYKELGLVQVIDGMGEMEDVERRIDKALGLE